MAAASINPAPYRVAIAARNGLVSPEWLKWLQQLISAGNTANGNSETIAQLQTDIAQLTASNAALTTRVAAAEAAIAANAGLASQVAALQATARVQTIQLASHEARLEALESYRTAWPARLVTANYAVTYQDFTVDADASAGALTVSLPVANNLVNGEYHNVKKIDSSTNIVTLDGNGTLIEGVSSVQLLVSGWSLAVQYDGSAWRIL